MLFFLAMNLNYLFKKSIYVIFEIILRDKYTSMKLIGKLIFSENDMRIYIHKLVKYINLSIIITYVNF